MDNVFFDSSVQPKGVRPKLMMLFTSSFARVSPNLSGKFALKYLFKPYSRRAYDFRTKTPLTELFKVQSLKGKVALNYFKGTSQEHVFLSHGWADTSVRFTHLIDRLLEDGFHVWVVDQIGHGKSDGDTAHIFGFVDGVKESLKFIKNKGYRVTALIGHSMGSLAILNQSLEILKGKKVVMIAAPTKFFENLFINTKKMGVSNRMLLGALEHVSKIYGDEWTELSPEKQTHKIKESFLMVHDKDDITCSYENFKELVKNTKHDFMTTGGLGHLKIMKNPAVLKRISDFLKA